MIEPLTNYHDLPEPYETLTVWEHPADYGGYSPDGHYVVMARTRDDNLLQECNWEVFITELESLNEPDHWEIFRAGHWLCGWVEYIIVNRFAPERVLLHCEQLLAALENYPVLDDEYYSSREWDAMTDYWYMASLRDRIEILDQAGGSIFASRRDTMPDEAYEYIRTIINE